MKRKKIIIIGTVVISTILVIFLIIRSLRKNYIVSYLNKMYGNQDFKIESIIPSVDFDFGNYSFVPVKIKPDGYIILISTPKLKGPFMFSIDSLNPFNLKDTMDNFIDNYYIEKINNHFSDKYNLKFDFMVSESKILEEYRGKIPTMNELIESDAIIHTDIYVTYKDDDFIDRTQYVKVLLSDFTKFLNISKTMQLYLYLSNGNNGYQYNVTISGDEITIKEGSNTYTYNIYEL